MVSAVLGIAPSSTYELIHKAGFPVLKMVIPKEKFISWVEANTKVCKEKVNRKMQKRKAGKMGMTKRADAQRAPSRKTG